MLFRSRGRHVSAVLASTQTIGRFELIRELGRGAQGTVHLARDPHLDRLVAIKALRLSGDTKDRAQRMSLLMQEARLVSKLHHPNIVTLFDAVEHQGAPCLVFEYVEGRPLSDVVVASERLPATQIVDIAIGILRGISFAHGKKVLHRDIKPANVMLTAAGTPRVMDFGIACEASAAPLSEKVLYGTPAYMAPEYVSEQRFLPASDLYAVGVLLYELLTGSQPISGANVYEQIGRAHV